MPRAADHAAHPETGGHVTTTDSDERSPQPDAAAPWVVDADGHVVEPVDIWERFLPAEFREHAPRLQGFDDLLYAIPGGTDPAQRGADMDVDCIERAYVFPTTGLGVQGFTDPPLGLALCRAVNDWMADYCDQSAGRVFGVGAIPSTNCADALAETRRGIEELGFAGVFRRPELYPGVQSIHDPSFEPLWEYLEAADAPIIVHSGFNPFVPIPYFTDRFPDSTVACHAALFPIEAMMALNSLILYGILDRHPRLRVGLVECGAMWAYSYVHRLDEHVEKWPQMLRQEVTPGVTLARRPSEYFRVQCFVSVEDAEPGLGLLVDEYPGSVIFASDYPHPDATFPGATRSLLATDQLTEGQRRAVCRTNALRLYGAAH
jgi:predicted TIM-barrel fold metal-dependent hydrolase